MCAECDARRRFFATADRLQQRANERALLDSLLRERNGEISQLLWEARRLVTMAVEHVEGGHGYDEAEVMLYHAEQLLSPRGEEWMGQNETRQ